jgi:Fe-S oxidoreductase
MAQRLQTLKPTFAMTRGTNSRPLSSYTTEHPPAGGTMCPSYLATLEEQHSTRGRAHMLFDMLQGEVVQQGCRDESVKRSLELCLSCKACKSECPANVALPWKF